NRRSQLLPESGKTVRPRARPQQPGPQRPRRSRHPLPRPPRLRRGPRVGPARRHPQSLPRPSLRRDRRRPDRARPLRPRRPALPADAPLAAAPHLRAHVAGAIDAMERAATPGSARAETAACTQPQLGTLSFNQANLDAAASQYNASLLTLDGYVYGLAGLAK